MFRAGLQGWTPRWPRIPTWLASIFRRSRSMSTWPLALTRYLNIPSFCRVPAYFWPYLRPHRRLIAGSMVALFAEVILRLLEPWPLKFVFDRLLHSAQRHALFSTISSIDSRLLLAY